MVKILIIDDSPFIHSTLKKIFASKNFETIIEAYNGEEGLKLYEEHKPDLVTLDITMPVMDGFETAKKLLKYDKNAKIIMLSAVSDKHVIQKISDLGVNEFLSKPFTSDEIFTAMSNVLGMDN